MKYYAVTEDPNELLHYGVKGMKWGQHIFGDKPKSPGYKRALGKLRKVASTKAAHVKSAMKKSSAQMSMNRQRRQQDKYNRAIQKAQRRIELVENLRSVDQARVYERGIDREYHNAVRAAKNQNKLNRVLDKQANRYERNERKMDKYLQQARQGKLKYGKLSDDQIQRVTQRLNAENNARKLGSAEKTWHQQKKEAFRKGKLSGIERGTAAAMEEVARAGTIYGIQNFMNRRKRNALAKQQGKETRIKNKAQNKKSARDIRQEVKQEAYETEIRSGKGFWDRSVGMHMSAANAARLLQENKATQNVRDRLANDRIDNWKAFLAENNYTDKEARAKFKIKNDNDIDRVIMKSKDLKKQSEDILNRSAFKKLSDQMQKENEHQKKIEAQEKENAKLKEKYESEVEQYKKDQEYNKSLKDAYDRDMAVYNKAVDEHNEKMREWNKANQLYTAKRSYGDRSAKDPGPKPVLNAMKPNKPTYKSLTQPQKPNYHKIDYSTPATPIPTYDDFLRLRGMGINVLGNNNNNGGKKPKKK